MKITLDQWLKISDAHRAASRALRDVEDAIANTIVEMDRTAGAHEEIQLLQKCLSHTDNAAFELTRFNPHPYSEWQGGDSSKDENTAIREPLCAPSHDYFVRGMSLETYRKNKKAAG